MIDFSIIVVSYYSADDLVSLIESIDDALGGEHRGTWHLTAVNNAVDDPLASHLPRDDRVSVVEAGGNLGYSGGINVGLANAPAARWIVFLNPDLTLHQKSLALLAEVLESGADAAVPLIVDANGQRQNSLRKEPTVLSAFGEATFGDKWASRPQALAETVRSRDSYTVPHAIDWATGAALAVRSDIVNSVGPWDAERFFMYSEETDYARRIRAGGGSIQFAPDAVVTHRAGGSGSSPELDALLEVNKLRYFRKWHGTIASLAFGGAILFRNLIRPHRAGSRAAVRALLSRRARAALPGGAR